MRLINNLLILALCLAFASCDEMTEFSPYDANTSQRNQNAENISKIQEELQNSDSLVFIAISDTHSDYSDLRAAVKAINEMEGISFVVVCGDITDWGLSKEFEDYFGLINRLNIPSVTMIGNHDYLSNGKLIFNKLFGPTNFSFDVGNYRMVMFDNVVWENGNQEPDFDWFKEKLDTPEGMTSIACFHIHPWDPQLDNGYADRMREIIENKPVTLSLFGHGHGYKTEEVNNRKYLMVPDISMRNLTKITLANKAAKFQLINY